MSGGYFTAIVDLAGQRTYVMSVSRLSPSFRFRPSWVICLTRNTSEAHVARYATACAEDSGQLPVPSPAHVL